jgi:hypothetical protein
MTQLFRYSPRAKIQVVENIKVPTVEEPALGFWLPFVQATARSLHCPMERKRAHVVAGKTSAVRCLTSVEIQSSRNPPKSVDLLDPEFRLRIVRKSSQNREISTECDIAGLGYCTDCPVGANKQLLIYGVFRWNIISWNSTDHI